MFEPVGISFLDEAMNVARSAPMGVNFHADVNYLIRNKEESKSSWYFIVL